MALPTIGVFDVDTGVLNITGGAHQDYSRSITNDGRFLVVDRQDPGAQSSSCIVRDLSLGHETFCGEGDGLAADLYTARTVSRNGEFLVHEAADVNPGPGAPTTTRGVLVMDVRTGAVDDITAQVPYGLPVQGIGDDGRFILSRLFGDGTGGRLDLDTGDVVVGEHFDGGSDAYLVDLEFEGAFKPFPHSTTTTTTSSTTTTTTTLVPSDDPHETQISCTTYFLGTSLGTLSAHASFDVEAPTEFEGGDDVSIALSVDPGIPNGPVAITPANDYRPFIDFGCLGEPIPLPACSPRPAGPDRRLACWRSIRWRGSWRLMRGPAG